jgi:hypothetical protein
MVDYIYDTDQYQSPNRLRDPITQEFVDEWETVADFDITLPDGRRICIPKGFVFDKASVPSAAWWYIPRDDADVVIAALVHDWLYSVKEIEGWPIARSEADKIFYGLTRQAGMRYTKAKLAYLAIRSLGWRNF